MKHELIKIDNYLLVVDDSVQPYDSSKVGNPLAHLPLNGSPILEGVPLLPPIKDDAEELAKEEINYDSMNFIITNYQRSGFIIGYNKAKEKFLLEIDKQILDFTHDLNPYEGALYGLNRLKYYLSQYPSEFETEDVLTPSQIFYPNDVPYSSPKTITTAQGIQWVGKYKYK